LIQSADTGPTRLLECSATKADQSDRGHREKLSTIVDTNVKRTTNGNVVKIVATDVVIHGNSEQPMIFLVNWPNK
jgi:lactam utilization protein B